MKNKLLFFASATGFVLALTVHLSAALFHYDVSQAVPFVWVLHIGAILVFAPQIIKLGKDFKDKRNDSGVIPPKVLINILFSNTPRWLIALTGICFVYAFVNFILFALNMPHTPEFREGVYYLQNHGNFIKNITAQEYMYYKSWEVRGFSGHWMFFYCIAAAAGWPWGMKNEK